MDTVYGSKIDAWLLAVLVPAMLVAGYAAFRLLATGTAAAWGIAALIAAIGVGLPLWLLLATHYAFVGPELVVRSGPFTWRVPVAGITDVTPTSDARSSPALSLDRLRIEYGRGRWIMVSPRDKKGFLREIETRRGAPGGV